ncbi:MAG: ribonuclease [Lachnospiraceae bacterium]|nr:ribonuclease [Lachnospiraceae bacterium]
MKKRINIFLIFLLSFLLIGCNAPRDAAGQTVNSENFSESEESSAETATDGTESRESPKEADESASEQEEIFDENENAPPSETPNTAQSEDTESAENNDGEPAPGQSPAAEAIPDENGSYTTKDDVARYIYFYGHLPSNFITKKEAEKLGWPGGSLEPYAPGMCIGGNRFGNYEGLLPEKEGRTYTECDIDTLGAEKRGAKRIVFSNDGLIYYTEDHYETFELLYGDETDG